MGWMDSCMHVCNIDLRGLFAVKDQRSTTSTRPMYSENGSSLKTDAEKSSNQKKVHEISIRKTRDKNGRPNGWRKVKIESVSQKRDSGRDVDGEHPEQATAANDGLLTTMPNAIKQKVEVKPTMDKYQGIDDRKPIDFIEIETSDSASEITLPDSLNSILTSFFGFHYTYDEVTQPELENLEISLIQNEIDERLEKEDVQRTKETRLVADKDIPIQKKEESTPSRDKRQEDESNTLQSTTQEKTTGITTIKNGNSKGKNSLDGRSETREPDTPIHDQHPQINTKHRDTDTRDDDADIGKNHDHHHEGQPKPLGCISDKYQPLHQIVKDLSAKEVKLQFKNEGIDKASLTTPYKSNTNTTGEMSYHQPNRTHNQPSAGVRAMSQAYRHGRSPTTTTNEHTPKPMLRLSLDVDGQTNKHNPHGSPSVDETSRQDVDRIKPETSIVPNDHQNSPDAFPFVPSRVTQVRPGSLRL